MSKTASGLIAHCKAALANNVQYVYGAKMEVLTYAQIKALQNLYGKSYVWDEDLLNAGKLCCDCSGLISSYTGITRSSSNYKSTATECVTIATLKANWSKYVGWGLWLSGHIGVVSDTEGYYYAMDGSARDMVHYPLSKQSWVYAIKLCDIDYTAETATETAEEDEEVKTTANISFNGKTKTCTSILSGDENHIRLRDVADLLGLGVYYDENTKGVELTVPLKEIKIVINGTEKTVKAVNLNGSNLVVLREIIAALGGLEIDYEDGVVVITDAV